jgi:hypothetical protein
MKNNKELIWELVDVAYSVGVQIETRDDEL